MGPCPHLDALKAISDSHAKAEKVDQAAMHAEVDGILAGLNKEQLKEAAAKFGSRSAKGRAERVEGIKRFISDRREMLQRTTHNEEGAFTDWEIINAFCPTGEGGGQDNSCSPSSVDRVDAVYDMGSSLKTRENAEKWNSKFEGESDKKVEAKVSEVVKRTLDEYGETTLPKVHAEVGGDKTEFMRAVNAMSKDGRLRLTPDTGSLHKWGQKGGDADLAMVDYGGAPMDIVSLTRNQS